MVDHLPPELRSENMARIRAKATVPEMRVRKAAHALGLRFRLHRSDLPGKPDLVFPRHKTIIFVHGCFWHQHDGCRRASAPKSRVEYWSPKLQGNVRRDAINAGALRRLGWNVHVIWECEIANGGGALEAVKRVFQRTRDNE